MDRAMGGNAVKGHRAATGVSGRAKRPDGRVAASGRKLARLTEKMNDNRRRRDEVAGRADLAESERGAALEAIDDAWVGLILKEVRLRSRLSAGHTTMAAD